MSTKEQHVLDKLNQKRDQAVDLTNENDIYNINIENIETRLSESDNCKPRSKYYCCL